MVLWWLEQQADGMYNSPNSSSIFLNIELCTMFFSEVNILKHVFFLILKCWATKFSLEGKAFESL